MKTGAYKTVNHRRKIAGNKRKLPLVCSAVLVLGTGLSGAVTLSVPAFADETLNARIAREKERYIMQQASRCSIEQSRASAAEREEDSSKAYNDCLKSYGIIHSFEKESFNPLESEGGPFEELGNDGERFYGIIDTPDGKKEIVMEEKEFRTLFTKDAQNLGMDDFFTLDDYGKEQLVKRLQGGQSSAGADEVSEEATKESVRKNAESPGTAQRRIFRKPKEGEDAPSRVYRDFGQ